MRKATVMIIALMALGLTISATSTLTAPSKVMLSKRTATANRRAAPGTVVRHKAYINVKDPLAIDALRGLGVRINGVFNGFVTAEIPDDIIGLAAAVRGVSQISLAQPAHLCNDTARFLSFLEPVQNGAMAASLQGEGVIIGMVDSGVDFNHINLCDENGMSRVVAVYMPEDSTGISPIIDGDTLPGSYYETPEQIALLTTDNPGSSHGTHTTGTATGSYRGNGWHGVAPEAEIVVCGIPTDELTDVNITNGVKYIMDYADKQGKPCVINMSIGTNSGPNDGTSYMCRTFASMSGPGRVCVLSAGNDGNAPICFHDTIFGIQDTVTTLLRNQFGGLIREGYVSMWSDRDQEHRTRVVVINRKTGELEYASQFIPLLPEDSVLTISSETDSAFAVYYTGEIEFANAQEPLFENDGTEKEEYRFHSYWGYEVISNETGHLLGFQYVADDETRLVGWCTRQAYFYSFGMEGITGGSATGSISDMATSDSVISVGSYFSRASYIDKNGKPFFYGNIYPYDIAYFTSYGPDERGIPRPDLCAPGCVVISSANRYNTEANTTNWPESVFVGGVEYPYFANQGTSMSAPIVTGAVALMMQVNPQLGPAAVREVLQSTAYRDVDVMEKDSLRWGAGKLHIQNAVNKVIDMSLLRGDVNADGEVSIADIQALIDIILDNGSSDFAVLDLLRADVNRDGEIQISDINAIIDLILTTELLL